MAKPVPTPNKLTSEQRPPRSQAVSMGLLGRRHLKQRSSGLWEVGPEHVRDREGRSGRGSEGKLEASRGVGN